MKLQILFGLGTLMVIVPGLLLGVSYADAGTWAPVTDIRWLLILAGLIVLLTGNLMVRRWDFRDPE